MTLAIPRRTPTHVVTLNSRAPGSSVLVLAGLSLALLGLALLGPSAVASAAPTITLKTRALPIPGVAGTGNILGAGAAIQVQYTVSGTEYGGFPPPVTGLRYYAPAGAELHPRGFATCTPSAIEASGVERCPKQSLAGPKGSAGGVVSFGSERVHERVSVQPFFAPGGGLGFDVVGSTPVSIEMLATGSILGSSPPFGLELIGRVPLVETVPEALDASITEIDVKVGAAYRRGGQTISYVTLPKRCPRSGLPVKSEMTFLGGATAQATYAMPCPKG
jgi:hypothetical protein